MLGGGISVKMQLDNHSATFATLGIHLAKTYSGMHITIQQFR